MLTGYVSLFCLIVTGILATWGVFSRYFDSLLQRLGLSVLAIACILRIPDKIAHMETPPELMLAHVGITLFGIGTAIKLGWRYKKRRQARAKAIGKR